MSDDAAASQVCREAAARSVQHLAGSKQHHLREDGWVGFAHRVAWEERCHPDSDAPQDRNRQVGSIPLHLAGAEVASGLFQARKELLDTASVESLAELDDMVSVYHFRHPWIYFLPRHEQMEAEVVEWEAQLVVDIAHPGHTFANGVVKADWCYNAPARLQLVQVQDQNQIQCLGRHCSAVCRRHSVSLPQSSCMSVKPADMVLTWGSGKSTAETATRVQRVQCS